MRVDLTKLEDLLYGLSLNIEKSIKKVVKTNMTQHICLDYTSMDTPIELVIQVATHSDEKVWVRILSYNHGTDKETKHFVLQNRFDYDRLLTSFPKQIAYHTINVILAELGYGE